MCQSIGSALMQRSCGHSEDKLSLLGVFARIFVFAEASLAFRRKLFISCAVAAKGTNNAEDRCALRRHHMAVAAGDMCSLVMLRRVCIQKASFRAPSNHQATKDWYCSSGSICCAAAPLGPWNLIPLRILLGFHGFILFQDLSLAKLQFLPRGIFWSTSICLVCSVLTALHVGFYIAEILKLMGKRWKTEAIQNLHEALSRRPCNIGKRQMPLRDSYIYIIMVHNTSPAPKSQNIKSVCDRLDQLSCWFTRGYLYSL